MSREPVMKNQIYIYSKRGGKLNRERKKIILNLKEIK
jgi:hypothetical protein